MTTILSVAEKPSVAKELARIIGGEAVRRRNGYSPYNHIFEIPSCEFKNVRAAMNITSVTGHMMEIEFEKSHKSWGSCQPVELFNAQINKSVSENCKEIQRTLNEEARRCNTLLLWLDCDLEGENICFEVIDVCLKANPRMDVYRARFSALIHRDIMRTLRMPERPNKNMSDAVEARQEIDLRIGAAFTRFQTLRLQSKFEALGQKVISYGPCQFPTLGFVVERHLRIEAFRSEKFWSISCEHEAFDPDERDGRLLCRFAWDRSRLFDRFACLVLMESCIDGGGVATVTRCDSKPTTHQRPAPLNTIELQKRASRFFRMGAEKTMQVAEGLYTKGIISYPRTETDYFKEGFELQPLVADHTGHSIWGPFANNLLNNDKFTWPRNGSHDDQAHPPIHPTKCIELNELQDDDRKIYELVAMHFLACCAQDAKGERTTIGIQIPEGGEGFTATGLMVTDRAWLEVYSKYEKWSANKVPVFRVGDRFTPKRLQMTEGKTEPPPPLSESDLITEMDRNGIGTDATIAQHISTIQQRDYAIKDNQSRFLPTPLGLALIEAYNSMGYQLNKPFLRASMEADCQKIARGEIPKDTVVKGCLEHMKMCFLNCTREASKLDQAVAKYFPAQGTSGHYTVITRNMCKCGDCNGEMDLREDSSGVGGGDNPGPGPGPGRGHNRGQGGGQGQASGNARKRFLFCLTCKIAHPLPRGELQVHGAKCPICKFPVLTVTNPETQRSHQVCSRCFRDPPGPPYSEEGAQELRCFGCAHERCELAGKLAGGDVDIAPCSQARCNGTLRLKRGGTKGLMIVCVNNNVCNKPPWWLPKSIQTAVPLENAVCQSCSSKIGRPVRKLRLQFNPSKAPPGVPTDLTACPSCSQVWGDIGETPLRLSSAALPASLPGGGGRGGGGRGGAAVVVNHPHGFGDRDQGFADRGGGNGFNRFNDHPPPAAAVVGISDYSAAAAGVDARRAGRGGRGGRGGGGGAAAGTMADHGADSGSSPPCKCGEPARLLTTQKEGPNKGRQFYSCPKPRDEQCGFFQWADEEPGAGSSSRGGWGSGAGGGGAGTGRPPSARPDSICSKCKRPGHFAKNCPG